MSYVLFVSRGVLGLMVGVLVCAPLMSEAVGRGSENFCAELDEREEAALERIDDKYESLFRGSDASAKRAERANELISFRAERDQQRNAEYSVMRSAAATAEQRVVVNQLVTTIESAMVTQRATQDTAIAAFEDEVEKQMVLRDEIIDRAHDLIKSDISSHYETAARACMEEETDEAAWDLFADDMRALKAFQFEERSRYAMEDDLAKARAARDEVYKDAAKDFATAIKEPLAAVRASLE